MTNFERIKAMSLDEVAGIMAAESCYYCKYADREGFCGGRCTGGVKKWLESEAEGNEE